MAEGDKHHLNQVKQFDYDPKTGDWRESRSFISWEPESFAVGGMRLAYKAYHCNKRDWTKYPMVLKLEQEEEDRTRDLVTKDVIMQWKCIEYAEAYNAHECTPKKVEFVPCQMVEFINGETKGQFGSLEKYIEGSYIKHNIANPLKPYALNERNTPQAFSHFTWEHSGMTELVVDIQGVGDVYTDPQIYSMEGSEESSKYGKANFGGIGILTFLNEHVCNDICNALGLGGRYMKVPGTGTVPVKDFWNN